MIASLLKRFTRTDAAGTIIHIPGLFYRFDNSKYPCGHVRLFGKPLRGWMIYSWAQMHPDWSKRRVWWLGLVSVIHIDCGENNELKSVTPAGWHVRFAKIDLRKIYGGYSLTFISADKGYSA